METETRFEKEVKPDPLLRRLGRVPVSFDIIRERPSEALPMFAAMVVLRVDYLAEGPCFHYLGLAEAFEPVPEGSMPPIYDAVFKSKEDGSTEFLGFFRTGASIA